MIWPSGRTNDTITLKVTILTTSFPIYSGIAVGIHVLEKARQLQLQGHEVNIVAPGHLLAPNYEKIDGISVFRFSYFFPKKWQKVAYGDGIPTNLKKSFLAKIQLPFFLFFFFVKALRHSKNCDVLHCHWTIAGLVGVWVSKIRKKKLVLSMHGAEVFVLGKNRILNYVLSNCDLIICNSTFTQSSISQHYPSLKTIVIQPGTDTNRFLPVLREGLRSKLKIDSKDVFVLTVGKFIPRKGFEYLIEAMNIIVNTEKEFHVKLRIGGRGHLKSAYEKKIIEFGLENHISFLGYVSDEDMPSYFTEADIFVLPSIVDDRGDTEGLGVVLVEANACGTPVIACDVGGIKDVVKEGYNGLLVAQKNATELANAILKLVKNEKWRQEMGNNGQKWVANKFSWKEIGEKINREYKILLKEK